LVFDLSIRKRCNEAVQHAIADARTWRRLLLTESPRPDRIRDSPKAPWFVVGTVCIGAFMGQLDASIVTVALPRIASGLRISTATVEWVSLSYLLVLVCTLAAIGRLADRFGRKLLYIDGFVVFTAGSLLCALAPNAGWLIGARVVQGLGAALLQANSVALIRIAMSDAQLGRAIGVQGTAQALGLGLGPAVGGALVSLGGWRLLFLVNVPVGAIGLLLGWLLLPRSRFTGSERAPFDLRGAVLLAGAGGAMLFGLSRVRSLAPVWVVVVAAAAVGFAVAFVVVERRARAPLVDMRLLAARPIRYGLAGALVSFAVIFGALFAIPFELAAEHVSAARAGLELAVLPVALGLTAAFTGRLADRPYAHRVMSACLVLTGAGLVVVALWHGTIGLLVGLALAGAGLGGFVPSNNASVMGAAPRARAGVLSGVLNMTRALGTALGVALAGLLYRGSGLTACLLALAGLALLGAASALATPSPQPPRR
jgi:EmrB/QacA subfamily drug resistance transporter